MKKDRDCGMPYPTYPNYPMPLYGGAGMGSGPAMPMTGGMMNPNMNYGMMNPNTNYGMMNPNTSYDMNGVYAVPANTISSTSSGLEEQLNRLTREVKNLDKRVSALESLTGTDNNTKYNTTNYQMM